MAKRTPWYSEDRLIGRQHRCDGTLAAWSADWKTETEEQSCDCCGQGVEPHTREWDDAAPPGYHLGPIRRLPGDMQRCDTCDESWEDWSAAIKRVYSSDALVAAVNREAPFRKALR